MTHGDAPVPLDELLAHREWVRRMARTLARDEAEADDLAQDAWVAAVESPPRDGSSLRGWFATLLRHRLLNRRKAEVRRAMREVGAVRPGESPETADVVAHAELHRRVVDAVLALDEPYRTAVLMRYFEDLPPREIARRLGVPVETVRSRVQRAVARLRDDLDSRHGGRGRSRAVLLALAEWGERKRIAPWIGGGLAMAAKTKVAAGALLLLLVAAIAVIASVEDGAGERRGTGAADGLTAAGERLDSAPGARVGRVADGAGGAADAAGGGASDGTDAAGRERTDSGIEPGTAAVRGRVLHQGLRRAAEGVAVSLSVAGAAPRRALTDARGVFTFDGVPEDRLVGVSVETGEFAPIVVPSLRLDRDEVRDLGALVLEPPAVLEVSVRDWAERPIEGAVVELHAGAAAPGLQVLDWWSQASASRDIAEPVTSSATDATGTVVFSKLRPGQWAMVVSARGFARAARACWTTANASAPNPIVVRLDRGHTVTGRVVDARGRTRASAIVRIEDSEQRIAAYAPGGTTDAEGRFRIDGVPPGDARILVGRPGRSPSAVMMLRVPTSGPVEVVVGGGEVRGRVTGADGGAPIAGARVRAYTHADGTVAPAFCDTITRDDGSYTLDVGSASSVYRFRVDRVGYSTLIVGGGPPEAALAIIDGVATRDFVLGAGVRVAGTVIGPDGPVAGATVAAFWANEGTLLQVAGASGEDGHFSLQGVPAGSAVVRAGAPGLRDADTSLAWTGELLYGGPRRSVVAVPPEGLSDVRIRLEPVPPPARSPDAEVPMVHVRGRVSAPGGSVPAETTVEIVGPQPGAPIGVSEYVFCRARVEPDGRFDASFAASWRPARFRVLARAPGAWHGSSESVALPPDATEVTLDVTLVPGADVVGRVVSDGDGGTPVGGARVSIVTVSSSSGTRNTSVVAAVTDATGRFRIPEVPAGSVTLSVAADAFATAGFPVRVPADAEPTLALERALDIAGTVRSADGTAVGDASATLNRVDAPAGAANWWSARVAPDGCFRFRGLRAGTYRLGVAPAPGSTVSFRRFEGVTVAAGTLDVAVVLDPAAAVTGRVLDDQGRPLEHARVTARLERGAGDTVGAETDGDGRFTVTGLAHGTYIVRAYPPRAYGDDRGDATGQWLVARLSGVVAGGDPLAIRLVRGLEIRGRLVDGSGASLAGAWVRADPLPGGAGGAERSGARPPGAETDAGGAFVITGLAPGEYRLSLVAGTQGARVVLALDGGAAVPAGATEVRLRAGDVRPVRGVVFGEGGAAVAGAGVTVSPAGGGAEFSATTDAEGRFSVAGVSDVVRYVVFVQAVGYVPSRLAEVDAGAVDLRVELQRGLAVSGRMLSAGGAPASSADLRFISAADGRRVAAKSDADGFFLVRGLEAGVWRVVLRTITSDRAHSETPCGEVRAGQADVELRAER